MAAVATGAMTAALLVCLLAILLRSNMIIRSSPTAIMTASSYPALDIAMLRCGTAMPLSSMTTTRLAVSARIFQAPGLNRRLLDASAAMSAPGNVQLYGSAFRLGCRFTCTVKLGHGQHAVA